MTDKEEILFIYLTPFVPLSFKGEGKEFLERGFAPLLLLLPLPLLREGGKGDGLLRFYSLTKIKYNLSAVWGYSSVGRALRSHRRGGGFESPYLHFASEITS